MTSRGRSRGSGLAALFAFFVLAALAGCSRGLDDKDADTAVSAPAYRDRQPVVLFDEGHKNHHTRSHGYRAFARLLENDGYRVVPLRGRFDAGSLAAGDVLVIVCAMGENATGDSLAILPQGVQAVGEWVEGGGSLLLVVDHFPFGPAVANLGHRFGADLGAGSLEDSTICDPASGSTGTLIFTRENGLLADHPITRGRNESEQVNRVESFDGTSVAGPPGSELLLRLSPAAVDLAPTVTVDRDGGDVRVNVLFEHPTPAAGRAQGIAFQAGRGRVVVLGESGMLTAQVKDGRRYGFTAPGVDNRRFALNIMHWLSHLI